MKFYQHVLALIFAIKEINKDQKILPNATLGFHIYDSHNNQQITYRIILGLLFKSHRFLPNYNCENHKNLVAIIGGLESKPSFQVADILTLYKIPQLTYGSFPQAENEMKNLISFYRMASNEDLQYMGMISLLRHFGWTWVGLFVEDDESGERFLETMESLLSQNGICSAFTRRMPNQGYVCDKKRDHSVIHFFHQIFKSPNCRTFFLYGNTHTLMYIWHYMIEVFGEKNSISVGKVWIITAQIDFALANLNRDNELQIFQGALSFMIHSKEVPGFQEFLHTLKPDWTEADGFLKNFWEAAFDCSIPNPRLPYKVSGTCTGEERLESLIAPLFEMCMCGHSYSIYNAVYAVTHALQALYSTNTKHRTMVTGKKEVHQDLRPWQLHLYLQAISFNTSTGERVTFNDNWEFSAGFDIMNLVTFPNRSFVNVKVGYVDPNVPGGNPFTIDDTIITWHKTFNQV
ncbi:hypothetical protein JD844_001054 [Phrynosoma platyrhinos]|uniref:Receptor ligand binding region domain-containing protein n=1 Tax=Phrynosoma platyrhinos TaxID=52577 RepID=A0ABQ7T906_PHRPL|nr:hypothetical protein JD844_001054 [Phrynosoma platyrhinos]